MYTTQTTYSASPVGGDRDLVLLIYILYLIGFFTGIAAVAGVVLAHLGYRNATGLKWEHLRWQSRLFWHGALWLIAIGMLHLLVVGLGVVTAGVGLVFMVVPWGLTIAWTVFMLWACVRGLYAAWLGRPVAAVSFRG